MKTVTLISVRPAKRLIACVLVLGLFELALAAAHARAPAAQSGLGSGSISSSGWKHQTPKDPGRHPKGPPSHDESSCAVCALGHLLAEETQSSTQVSLAASPLETAPCSCYARPSVSTSLTRGPPALTV